MKETSTEDVRLREAQLVIGERKKMVAAAQKLVGLLESNEKNRSEVTNLILELSAHLSNIGGFGDKNAKRAISAAQRALTYGMAAYELFKVDAYIKSVLPLIVGIQVDFTKRPFRIININFEALKAKININLKR